MIDTFESSCMSNTTKSTGMKNSLIFTGRHIDVGTSLNDEAFRRLPWALH
jgi:hypothetical protein